MKKTQQPPVVRPRYRLMTGDVIALGPGKVELLEHVAATGSIASAAGLMSMSYNRAWQMIKIMNACFREPLVIAQRGGREGGGASLSDVGQQVIQHYRRMEHEASEATEGSRAQLLALLK